MFCSGEPSIILVHERGRPNQRVGMRRLHHLLMRSAVGALPGLRPVYLRAEGSCCWKLVARRGSPRTVVRGATEVVAASEVRAARIVDCPEIIMA